MASVARAYLVVCRRKSGRGQRGADGGLGKGRRIKLCSALQATARIMMLLLSEPWPGGVGSVF